MPSTAPPGCRSFYVEFSAAGPLDGGTVERQAVEALAELGFVRSPGDVLFTEARDIPHAYVLYDERYGAAKRDIVRWLAERTSSSPAATGAGSTRRWRTPC